MKATFDRRVGRLLGATMAAAVIAGCGESSPTHSVSNINAPAKRNTANLSTNSAAGTETRPSLLAFARCMRAHGVPNFPDPRPLAQTPTTPVAQPAPSGGFTANPYSPAYQTASNDCRSLAVASRVGPSQSHRMVAVQLRFAVCLRANGVSNFPDPSSGAEIGSSGTIGGQSPGTPAFQAAEKKCSRFLPRPPGLPGGGPSALSVGG